MLSRFSCVIGLAIAFADWAKPATEYMQANVPFAFVFAGADFAPGSYRIGAGDNGLIIIEERNLAATALSVPSSNQQQNAGLQFENREGKKYLVGVTLPGAGQRSIVTAATQQ